jgi:tRNA A-37 threonylcarbamoyl transferase component Bud32
MPGFSSALRLPIAKVEPCSTTGRLTLMSIQFIRCKIVDLFHSHDAVCALDTEVCNYAALKNLQGVVIPRVHGYYDVWGLLKLLALQVVGTAIPEDAPIDAEMRIQMKSALSRIHSAGYVHGDIARRNFCQKGKRMFLVDLETLAVGSTIKMEDELAAVDAL